LVADRHVEIGSASQLFSAPDLGNRRAQLMVRFEPVLRTMDISLQLSVSEVIESVDAAHQLIELEGLWRRSGPNPHTDSQQPDIAGVAKAQGKRPVIWRSLERLCERL
jgi:hypothetical protein